MLVKIRNKVYDSEEENIMIILQDKDEDQMHCLKDNTFRFCFYPKNSCIKEIEEFMRLDIDGDHGA